MRVADTVVTFGSSIGIEAVFGGKPSVLLGPSFYSQLKGPYLANSHQHAIELLSDDLMPAAEHEALMYGFWQNTHGIPFRYFQPDGLFDGLFKGQQVYPKPTKSIGDRLNRKWSSVKKRVLPKRAA